MTTTPPTWSELHAMVPELRPEESDALHGWLGVTESNGMDNEGDRDTMDAVHAKLCGFAAVEWLARQERYGCVSVSVADGEWCVELCIRMAGGEPDLCVVSEIGPTLDAALRAAVAAVAGEGK